MAALAVTLATIFGPASANNQTVGLFQNDAGSFDGYTLLGPLNYGTTYLLDHDGRTVHTWASGSGSSAYLLPDGSLVRVSAGNVRRYSWEGTLLWRFAYDGSHHDVEVLPNGNVLMIAYDYRTAAEAVAAGRDPSLLVNSELWADKIIEVQPTGPTTGDIVWEWRAWDHLVQDYDADQENFGVVADHPELIDINYFGPSSPAGAQDDWVHPNAVDYNPALDQIVFSARHFSELWVIDHSTTPAEAAGHAGGDSGKGGDLLYRWGNPAAYDAGGPTDQQLFNQHDTQWIEPGLPGEGNLLMFNNGLGRPAGSYSSVVEITPPVDVNGNYSLTPGQAFGPAAPAWEYTAPTPTDFYSSFISGAVRLPNGNTLIVAGAQGKIFEVTPSGNVVWRYISPVTNQGPRAQGAAPGLNRVFRAYRYAAGYPGLAGRDLTPGDPIEILDSDGDGLSNLEELKAYGTDPNAADTDGDSCPDPRELGNVASTGGRRDPLSPWDYFNPTNDGLNRTDDIIAVLRQYFTDSDDSNYNPDTDRTLVGPNHWNLGPPDGLQRIDDVVNVLNQYLHDCA